MKGYEVGRIKDKRKGREGPSPGRRSTNACRPVEVNKKQREDKHTSPKTDYKEKTDLLQQITAT